MNLNYRINRLLTKRKLKKEKEERAKAFTFLNLEQKRVFNLVKELVKNNNESIRFDLKTNETIIALPHLLVVLKDKKVQLLNTNGFYTEEFPLEIYEYLMDFIILEGHRYRRKLKQDIKIRVNEFLDTLETAAL